MHRILLTGASGFVGKNLIPYLRHHLENLNIIHLSIRYGNSVPMQAQTYIHLAGKAHDTSNNTHEKAYFEANYLLTKTVYDAFLEDHTATCFIYMSSIKAIVDSHGDKIVDESYEEVVQTIYGKSKKLAEKYIFSHLPKGKRVYILRPCMIHGPGNKGNLNLLYKIVSKGIPWPLAAFDNKRSFCSVENICFVIKELIEKKSIPSGIYNITDDIPLSTNDLIKLIANSKNKKARLLSLPKSLIKFLAKSGDYLKLPLNSERLQKLTESYIVSNAKIVSAIGKPLPISSTQGLLKTFLSFNKDVE